MQLDVQYQTRSGSTLYNYNDVRARLGNVCTVLPGAFGMRTFAWFRNNGLCRVGPLQLDFQYQTRSSSTFYNYNNARARLGTVCTVLPGAFGMRTFALCGNNGL
jgi:hypothetical protein